MNLFFRKKKVSSLVPLFVGGVILTVGDIVAAEWVRIGGPGLYLWIMMLYMIAMVFLIKSYETKSIATASTILVIFNVSILTVAGALLFNEPITVTKIIGLLLGISAVALIEFGKD